MLGLSIFEGIWEFTCNVINLLLIPIVSILLVLGLPWIITGKTDILQKLKKHIVYVILCILLLSLILPLLCLYYGAFKKDAILYNSDILGYYGAVIGGVVTVLGVYWTLNYESKKSKEERVHEREKIEEEREYERKKEEEERKRERKKEEEERKREREKEEEERKRERQKEEEERKRERVRFEEERRKNSLPILRFSYSPNSIPVIDGVTRETTPNEKGIYKIILNTSDRSSVNKICENGIERGTANYKTIFPIIESGNLYIDNVGLGAAILSNIYLFRKDTKEIVKNLQADTQNRYIIQPETNLPLCMFICSNNFSKDDVLYVDFRDIYSNKYRYIISFENNFSNNEEEKTIINNYSVDVLPKQIRESK